MCVKKRKKKLFLKHFCASLVRGDEREDFFDDDAGEDACIKKEKN